MALSFRDILLCGSATSTGTLALNADAVTWVSREGDVKHGVRASSIASAAWYEFARSCQLWLFDRDGGLHRFDGFSKGDFDNLNRSLTLFTGEPIQKRAIASAGQSWGTLRLTGKVLEWVEDREGGKIIAPIPLSAIAQTAQPAKGEVELQFVGEDTMDRDDEACMEMRLYVPYGHSLQDAAQAAAAARARAEERLARTRAEGGDGERLADLREEVEEVVRDPAVCLQALISKVAGIASETGKAIAELGEEIGQFLVPRGRYEVELYPTSMRMVGRTYDFKVAYKSIARMFYLPKPSPTGRTTQYFFVISLDEPVRQGSQRYPHLVMQLKSNEAVVPVSVSEEDIAAGRYDGLGKDKKEVSGEESKVVASLLKRITGKPVFKPGDFRAVDEGQAVHCSYRSNEGYLYPLDKSFVFVHKPTQWIRYADIECVEFRRTGRTVDLALQIKPVNAEPAREVVFQSVDKREKDRLRDFLGSKAVRVMEKSEQPSAIAGALAAEADDEDEEDDEDFDEHAAGRKSKRRDEGDSRGSSDVEEDGDYDGGSGSGSSSGGEEGGGSDGGGAAEDEDAGFRKKSKGGKKANGGAGKAPSKRPRPEGE